MYLFVQQNCGQSRLGLKVKQLCLPRKKFFVLLYYSIVVVTVCAWFPLVFFLVFFHGFSEEP